MLASDALIQGALDTSAGAPHARHAQERFPADSRFRLAEAVSRREAKTPANKPGAHRLLLVYGSADPPRRDLSLMWLRETRERLLALVEDPVVGPEARVRLGILLVHLDELPEAGRQVQLASEESSDPFVRYLAFLMSGQVLEMVERVPEAERAYRSARAMYPDAASGLSTLASLLFLTDRRDEAVELYGRMMTTGGSGPDPWREFGFGSYRFWPQYFRMLREEVAR